MEVQWPPSPWHTVRTHACQPLPLALSWKQSAFMSMFGADGRVSSEHSALPVRPGRDESEFPAPDQPLAYSEFSGYSSVEGPLTSIASLGGHRTEECF